jgi:hypothetical protein
MREYQFEIAPRNPAAKKLNRDPPELSYNPPTVLSLLQTYPVAVKFSVSNAAHPCAP